jgi:ribosomal protein S18 acetylase RimI-like enzyme
VTIRILQVAGRQRNSLPALDRGFRVERRLKLCMSDGVLSHEAVAVSPFDKRYPEPSLRLCTTFISRAGDDLVGRIDVGRHWTGFASIDDLVVAPAHRGRGVGSALVRRAQQWAVASGLAGLRAETQDVNVAACSLYARLGFCLSGFDIDLYRAAGHGAGEIALFWYWHRPAAESTA